MQASKTLIVREGCELDSPVSRGLLVQAGWVLRLLETKELEDGIKRARIVLEPVQTCELERALQLDDGTELSTTPRSARGRPLAQGWVDAIDADGSVTLMPYSRSLLASPRSRPGSPGGSSTKGEEANPHLPPPPEKKLREPKLSAQQVHDQSQLPLSAERGAADNQLRVPIERRVATAAGASKAAAAGGATAGGAAGTKRSGSAGGGLASVASAARKESTVLKMWGAIAGDSAASAPADDMARLRSIFDKIDLDARRRLVDPRLGPLPLPSHWPIAALYVPLRCSSLEAGLVCCQLSTSRSNRLAWP